MNAMRTFYQDDSIADGICDQIIIGFVHIGETMWVSCQMFPKFTSDKIGLDIVIVAQFDDAGMFLVADAAQLPHVA